MRCCDGFNMSIIGMSTLSVRAIRKCFGEKEVLKNVTFEANTGEILTLIGRNASGKSTFLNILAGLLQPDGGSILFNNKPLGHKPSSLRNFGFMLEESTLIDQLSGLEFLKLTARIYGLKNQEILKHINRYSEKLFEDPLVLNKPVETYSTGMRKKVEFISCLLHEPSVLILDEALNGMDALAVSSVTDILQEIKSTTLILIISHDIYQLTKMADRAMLLHDGVLTEVINIKAEAGENPDALMDALMLKIEGGTLPAEQGCKLLTE